MTHINELWRIRLSYHIRRKSWGGLPIDQRYNNFKRLVKLRPILREVILTDKDVGLSDNIVEPDGSVHYVKWEAHRYNPNRINAYQSYRGADKHYWTYDKGSIVLKIVGWK